MNKIWVLYESSNISYVSYIVSQQKNSHFPLPSTSMLVGRSFISSYQKRKHRNSVSKAPQTLKHLCIGGDNCKCRGPEEIFFQLCVPWSLDSLDSSRLNSQQVTVFDHFPGVAPVGHLAVSQPWHWPSVPCVALTSVVLAQQPPTMGQELLLLKLQPHSIDQYLLGWSKSGLVSTHLNFLVKWDHFPIWKGENSKTILKPPPKK